MWPLVLMIACSNPQKPADSAPSAPTETADTQPVTDSVPTGDTDSAVDTDPPVETGEDTEDTEETADGTWRSALYPDDWAPGFEVDGAFLHDFSYAGYHNGERPLPKVPPGPSFSVVDMGADPSGAGDSTAAFQAALDAAAGAGGGVAWVPAGLYRVDGSLTVGTSGVVLAGEGPASSRVAFTAADGTDGRAHLTFRGARAVTAELPLVVDGEALSSTVYVADASGLSPGDDVSVGWTITDAFVEDHGMTGTWAISNGQYREFFRRNVVSVDTASDPDAVVLDVPLRYPALVRDGASLVRETGLLAECGVVDLGVATAVEYEQAWAHDRSHAIAMDQAKDCYVRNLGSFESPYPKDGRGGHLASNGLLIEDSKRVTVADSDLGYAQNRGEGGNGYLYELMQSSEILVRDSAGRYGRHNFIQNWDFGTSGCVFLRPFSEGGEALVDRFAGFGTIGYSEYHHSLAMANLVDQAETHDGWKAANRGDYSSGAGHAATQSVFWNTSGDGWLKSYQFGLGYVIGTGVELNVDTTVLGVLDSEGTEPEDFHEGIGLGDTLVPASLYDDQLARRLAE